METEEQGFRQALYEAQANRDWTELGVEGTISELSATLEVIGREVVRQLDSSANSLARIADNLEFIRRNMEGNNG